MSMLLETKGRAIQLLFLLVESLPDNTFFYVMYVEIDSFYDPDPVAFNW